MRRFWAWWAGARDAVAEAFETGGRQRVQPTVEPRVQAVHRDLTWYIGGGTRARRMLVLSGSRHPALRGVAERWRIAGPADDAEWEYHPAFPAEPDAFSARVHVGDLDLDPCLATALATSPDAASPGHSASEYGRFRLDLTVHHPAFDQLDELGQVWVAGVLVRWALGEDDTDRWIGTITTSRRCLADAVPVARLDGVTAELASRWAGERWTTVEGAFDHRKLVASVRHPLHRVDHPLFDEHLAVRLPYADSRPDGLPTDSCRAELDTFQAVLLDRLRSDAVLVAKQTAAGEHLLHFYADSASRRAYAIRGLLSHHLGPLATVRAEYDPGWHHIDHLRP